MAVSARMERKGRAIPVWTSPRRSPEISLARNPQQLARRMIHLDVGEPLSPALQVDEHLCQFPAGEDLRGVDVPGGIGVHG